MTATKAAWRNLERSLGTDLVPEEICVDSMALGYIRTEMCDELITDEAGRNAIASAAPAVGFLLFPPSAYVTGEGIIVDGSTELARHAKRPAAGPVGSVRCTGAHNGTRVGGQARGALTRCPDWEDSCRACRKRCSHTASSNVGAVLVPSETSWANPAYRPANSATLDGRPGV